MTVKRTPVPEHLVQQTGPLATPPQVSYLIGLRDGKDLSSLDQAQVEWLISTDFTKIPKQRASDVIGKLKELPWKPRDIQQRQTELHQNLPALDVPAGRYCVLGNDGELKFYQVWRPKDNPSIWKLYVMFGPYQGEVQPNAKMAIMQKIAANPREAAIRFGQEIKACSNCGRRLTNRISRELAIGPICGGRLWGDEFKAMAKAKRAELVAMGLDPDEELDDDV